MPACRRRAPRAAARTASPPIADRAANRRTAFPTGDSFVGVDGGRIVEPARVAVDAGEPAARAQGLDMAGAVDALEAGEILLVQLDRLSQPALRVAGGGGAHH